MARSKASIVKVCKRESKIGFNITALREFTVICRAEKKFVTNEAAFARAALGEEERRRKLTRPQSNGTTIGSHVMISSLGSWIISPRSIQAQCQSLDGYSCLGSRIDEGNFTRIQ